MRFISLIIFIFSINSFAKLEEIKTKQAVNNIRLISKSGKYTYFKNNHGELKLSHNYDMYTVLKTDPYNDFLITPSDDNDDLLIEIIKTPHRTNWFFASNDIYLTKLGSKSVRQVASGHNPKLHREGKFLSVYNPLKSQIDIINLADSKQRFTIKLSNKSNPYFIPEVYMITPHDIIYTDSNSKGHAAVLLYSTLEKKFETIYKAQAKTKKLELCVMNDSAYIGEFSYQMLGRNSTISKVALFNNSQFQNSKILYSSRLADIGNMICQKDLIYFIKASEYISNINYKKTNIAILNLKTEAIKTITELDDVTQMFQMGDMILTPYKGKILVVKGKNKVLDDTIKKVKE